MVENQKSQAAFNDKRTWYTPITEIYGRARPSSPQALIELAIAKVNLNSNSTILEIGCCPGNATVPFARSNASIVCIEHNQGFCFLAKQNTNQFPKVTVCHESFERWQLEKNKYDAVLSANALHQIPSAIALSSYFSHFLTIRARGLLDRRTCNF